MGRWEQTATAPARLRRGLPVLPDGSRRHPRLLALPPDELGSPCNNGGTQCIGGEPMLHPELPELVRHARDAGFPAVSICTNGVLFHKQGGYLPALADPGLTCVRYDHRPGSANDLANIGGLGDRYPETAIELLSRRDVHTHFVRILLASTFEALPDYRPGARVLPARGHAAVRLARGQRPGAELRGRRRLRRGVPALLRARGRLPRGARGPLGQRSRRVVADAAVTEG